MPSRSAACELRGALLRKSGDAFRVVGAITKLALIIAFDIELRFQRSAGTLVDSLLSARQAACWGCCKLLRQRVYRRSQLGVLDTAPDEAPLSCQLRWQLIAQESQPHGARVSNEPRQKPGATRIRHQSQFRERLYEARRLRCNHHV